MDPAPLALSSKAARTPESPIAYFMQQAVENPSLISLAAGLVDEPSLPAADIARAAADILGNPAAAQAALQYGTTQGHGPLREKVLALAAERDGVSPEHLGVTPAEVVVTTGSQQLLYLLGEILLDPGDLVITEAPSYFVYHGVLASKGVSVRTVPMDDEGMCTDALEELLLRLEKTGELDRLKLIYTVDYFQNPTGLTLSAKRREHLVELVRRFSRRQRILVLEDAAYRELRFEGEELPSIKSFDEGNRHVVSASTFSKPCAPGLKTGYALMPAELVGPLLRFKGNHDFGSGNFAQYVADRLLETGAYARHVEHLRGVYRTKRDAMLAALGREFADWPEVRWTRPKGGMFVWATFPPEVNTGPNGPLAAAAVREGMLYVPGEFGHVAEAGPVPTNEMRLSFGDAGVEEIAEGIRRLRRAAESVVRRGQRGGRKAVPVGS